jgi:hemolysin D
MGMFSTEDRHEFKPLLVEIEDRPTSPLSRLFLWLIVGFLVITFLWLYLAKIDIVVTARGKVMPLGEVKVLQPVETGVIKKILVKEGDKVSKGDIIMEIDPSIAETSLGSKLTEHESLVAQVARLEALIYDKTFVFPPEVKDGSIITSQQLLYNSTKNNHLKQQELLHEQLEQVKEQIASAEIDKQRLMSLQTSAAKKLARLESVKEIVAREKYDNAVDKNQELLDQINIKEHDNLGLFSKKTELEKREKALVQEYKNTLLEQYTQKEKEKNALEAEIDMIQFQKTKKFLTSPVDGFVAKLFIHTIGGVVTPAEKLVSIVPSHAPLVIKVSIMNKDRGHVQQGSHCVIKVDTYDFQRYGMLKGEITHIANDATEDEKLGPVFEAYIKPEKLKLEYKGRNYPVRSGMSVSAELKVGQRRVINFFIYPLVKYMDEGMSVR